MTKEWEPHRGVPRQSNDDPKISGTEQRRSLDEKYMHPRPWTLKKDSEANR